MEKMAQLKRNIEKMNTIQLFLFFIIDLILYEFDKLLISTLRLTKLIKFIQR